MKLIVTGAAGFIGMHTALSLLGDGHEVVGIDNLNDYYDLQLKQDRLEILRQRAGFRFFHLDIADSAAIAQTVAAEQPDRVVHLAAQAGVRYSLENPMAYVSSNLAGFASVLEACRHSQVPHLIYASSSSVYGNNTHVPFSEHDPVDHPLSLYAASKRANELMAHAYAHLYALPVTGLRFFTVYGPWGRPDMALFKFTKGILEGAPIPVFNEGKMVRDFTYIDDVVEGVIRVIDNTATPNPEWSGDRPDPATSYAPFRIYNIGNSEPVQLMRYIEVLEQCLGKKARLDLLPMQDGDVPATSANTESLEQAVGFRPDTTVETGIARFVEWYRQYYKIS